MKMKLCVIPHFLSPINTNLKIMMLMLFQLAAINTFAGTYSGGDGTEATPYQIATTSDLIELSQTAADWGKDFIQTADITFDTDESKVDWDGDASAGGASTEGFSPIGNESIKFTGNYDGKLFSITNLYINREDTDYIGFFGSTAEATIVSVGLVDCDIKGNVNVGGLVGSSTFISIVSSCYVTGSVRGISNTGGLVGHSTSSTIRHCYTISDINGNTSVGGLVGNNNSNIHNCYTTGSTSGVSKIGGLLGVNYSVGVSNCYATGNVVGENTLGGLIGINQVYSKVRNSYSTGSVSGKSSVGGLVGVASYFSSVRYCYSVGNVTTLSSNGGLIGFNDDATITDSYWDMETSSQTDSNGGTGKTTDQMKNKSTFTNWNFNDTWFFNIDNNLGYPCIRWTRYSGGHGTAEAPFQISNIADLIKISQKESDWDKHFIQTADILFNTNEAKEDWNGDSNYDTEDTLGFLPIGDNNVKFSGLYNGKDYTISNLYINREDTNYVGLFGYTNKSEVTNIGLIDADIQGKSVVGSLIGKNENSTTSNSYAIGSVKGESSVGGLIGYSSNSTLTRSYVTVSVTGTGDKVGGLIGVNSFYSKVFSSYALATINGGGGYIGGLIGDNYNHAIVSNSYANGSVNGGEGSVGGLAGKNESSEIKNSYAIVSVFGDRDYVGGLVGEDRYSTISNSYATGSVTGNRFKVGGLVGGGWYSTISNCYATGFLNASSGKSRGLIGYDYSSTVTDCYWDMETTGQATSSDDGSLTTAEFKDASKFTWTFGTDDVNPWIHDANGRPYLDWQTGLAVTNGIADGNTISGNITSIGSATITDRGVRYRLVDEDEWYQQADVMSTDSSVSVTLTGLPGELDYYASAYAVSDGKTYYGDTIKFTAQKINPILSNISASSLIFGSPLSSSVVTGMAKNPDNSIIGGTWRFTNGGIIPEISDSNTTNYSITFIPTDGALYNSVTSSTTLTVLSLLEFKEILIDAGIVNIDDTLITQYGEIWMKSPETVKSNRKLTQAIIDAVNDNLDIIFYELNTGWNLIHLPSINMVDSKSCFDHLSGLTWMWNSEILSYEVANGLRNGNGYWINWNSLPACVSVADNFVEATRGMINLEVGWNLIGTVDRTSLPETGVLGIWEWDSENGYYIEVDKEQIEDNKGYWIFSM